jgi:hypothetical protein
MDNLGDEMLGCIEHVLVRRAFLVASIRHESSIAGRYDNEV